MISIKRWWTWAGEVWNDPPRLTGILGVAAGLRLVWLNWKMSLAGRWGWGEIPMLGWFAALIWIGGGIALYRRSKIAKWLLSTTFTLMTLFYGFLLVRAGRYPLPQLLFLAGGIYGVYLLWTMDLSPPSEESDDETTGPSIVLLRSTPLYLDSAILTRAASRAFGAECSDMGDDGEAESSGDLFVGGNMPVFLCFCRPHSLAVHSIDEPLDDHESVAASIREPRARKAVEAHKAWIAITSMDDTPDDPAAVYRACGRLAAELYDEECLGVLLPQFTAVYSVEPGTEAKLRSDDPVAAIRGRDADPILLVDEDDPLMVAAMQEAKRRWPEFVEVFEEVGEGERPPCFVKVPFKTPKHPEFMWLRVTAMEGDSIFGVLDSDPGMAVGVKAGDRVRKPVADVCDWIIVQGGAMTGGFTAEAMKKIVERDAASSNEERRRE